jgi:hypothetical protein
MSYWAFGTFLEPVNPSPKYGLDTEFYANRIQEADLRRT